MLTKFTFLCVIYPQVDASKFVDHPRGWDDAVLLGDRPAVIIARRDSEVDRDWTVDFRNLQVRFNSSRVHRL